MKKNSLTTALLAGLAGAAGLVTTANAVNLNPDGLGQVLIYPFYTVDGGNNTQISVVNTTNRVKAVKVRFLEARNSKEVLDFNLYLSPFDVWTGAVISQTADGPGYLVSTDTSCTVPTVPGAPRPFVTFELDDFRVAGVTAAEAAILTSDARTRQGHIEIIEMGVLQTGTGPTQLAEEATHGANGVPSNCAALTAAWTPPSGAWLPSQGAANIDLPSGGLFGAGAIVEVAKGSLVSYNAEAIEGFYTDSANPGALHANPGTVNPDLTQANNGPNVIASIFANNGGAVVSETFPLGLTRPDPVSLVFMHDAIYNEYNTEAAIGGVSEWVVTFPTKRYYVDAIVGPAIAPFTNVFGDNGSSCEPITISYWNREEGVPGSLPGNVPFSPPPPAGTPSVAAFCNEANVLAFNQSDFTATTILGAKPTTGLVGIGSNLSTSTVAGTTFENGWTRIAFDNPLTPGQQNVLTTPDGSQYFGLPVVGFWAVGYVNTAALPGILATYNGTFRHRGSRASSG